MTARRLGAWLACTAAAPASAHGIGQRYDLPLPLELYLAGAAATVLVSCLWLLLFVRARPESKGHPALDLGRRPLLSAMVSPPAIAVARAIAVAAFAFLVVAGFLGNQNTFRNIVPLAVWALWWVGLAYVSALIGDVWRLVNPLETIFAAAERACARLTGKPLARDRELPRWVGAWPVVALYLAFLWMEMVWDGTDSPAKVAAAMGGYALLTWAGMWLFGRERWLEQGEVFNRVFGLLARFAPLGFELRDRRVVRWELRPYAVGLLRKEPASASETMLVMAILAAVSFDGFLETPAWAALVEALVDPERAVLLRTAGIVVAPLAFLAAYLLFCRIISLCGALRDGTPRGSDAAMWRVAGLFAMTLVPIAIAYLIAHYLSFLAIACEYAIALASDPMGLGWNLFNTAQRLVRPGVVDARLVWVVSVAVIVAGHVAALYLGHVLALREFAGRRAAINSQWPMLVLMVAYTMLSLWIIAQPIVNVR